MGKHGTDGNSNDGERKDLGSLKDPTKEGGSGGSDGKSDGGSGGSTGGSG